jgi:hypothetical protein
MANKAKNQEGRQDNNISNREQDNNIIMINPTTNMEEDT